MKIRQNQEKAGGDDNMVIMNFSTQYSRQGDRKYIKAKKTSTQDRI